jgi:hypothetical protein
MDSEKCNSRNIPLPIQREIRQRCGFGCVICGLPLWEYHHINGWASVQEHKADEITLLCDKHHREATAGLITTEQVIAANESPHNLRTGQSSPLALHFEGDSCEIHIGGNYFTTSYVGQPTESIPLMVDGIPLVGFLLEDGQLLLNLIVFDQFNDVVLRIANNQLFYSISPWDIQVEGKTLVIREKARQFLIRITFDPPNRVVIDKGRLLCNGVEVLVDSNHILVTNNSILISGCSAINCHGGLIIGSTPVPISGFFALPKVDRYLGDSKASLAWAESLKKEFMD